MAEGPVLLSDSGSEGGRAPPRRIKRFRTRRRPRPRPTEVIDLTGEEDAWGGAMARSSSVVIDLTGEDEEPPSPARAPTRTPPAGTQTETLPGFPAAVKDEARTPTCSTDSDCSPTTFNSDLSSLASPLLESDCFSLSPSSSNSWGAPMDPGSPPPATPPRSLPASTSKAPSRKRPRLAVKQEPLAPPSPRLADPSRLHKLRYFRRMPVHHLLRAAKDEDSREVTEGVVQDPGSLHPRLPLSPFPPRAPPRTKGSLSQQRTWPISSRKLDLVQTTMEESFPEGTLQFLTDFVTPRHYPPCTIVAHLVRQILLGPHHWGILKDAYTLLMKIQALHPASTTTDMGWDWPLLRHIMEDEEKPRGRLLFLQYVVQTLEDNAHLSLQLQHPSMTIAKQVLSCDQSFGNIKEVIGWLVAAVTGIGFCRPAEQQNTASPASRASRHQHSSCSPLPRPTEPGEDVPPGLLAEKVVLLLQRLLSIAVEVDRSPNCSAHKIADAIFPSVLNIPLRSQRETFLATMESHLLRCRLLELLFHHSCEVSTALPLSLAKILHFLSHSSLLLQCQDQEATWQRWDEMLQHLISLLVSYQNVVLDHLWSSLGERMQPLTSAPRPKQQEGDDITMLDVQQGIEGFCHQLQQSLGAPLPASITEKVHMLQALLLTASCS